MAGKLTPRKISARNPVCPLCGNANETRHMLRIFSKSGKEKDLCFKVQRMTQIRKWYVARVKLSCTKCTTSFNGVKPFKPKLSKQSIRWNGVWICRLLHSRQQSASQVLRELLRGSFHSRQLQPMKRLYVYFYRNPPQEWLAVRYLTPKRFLTTVSSRNWCQRWNLNTPLLWQKLSKNTAQAFLLPLRRPSQMRSMLPVEVFASVLVVLCCMAITMRVWETLSSLRFGLNWRQKIPSS